MISNARLARVLDLPTQREEEGPRGKRSMERRKGAQRRPEGWSWETDSALRVDHLGSGVKRALGYAPEALIGARLDSLTATGSDAARLGGFLSGRAPFRDLDLLLAQYDGTPALFRLSGHPLFCPKSGDFLGFRGEARDLTDPAARETALRRLVESTEAANRSKRDFIANMSHDLRTPLNAIIGFSEIMTQQAFGPLGDERYRDYAQMTLDSATHLLELIGNLLEVANIEAGKLELRESEIDPSELLRRVQRLVCETSDDEAPTVTSECAAELPLIYADDSKLQQALRHLLSNAVKFTPGDGRVHLSARRSDDGGVCFVVEDNGIGIAAEDLATALAPFGQVKLEGAPCIEGSGLGLPLAKSLAELHGGTLELDSEPGRGSVVTLTLPAWRCRQPSS